MNGERPQDDPLVGMTLGGCQIEAVLGRGGMGVARLPQGEESRCTATGFTPHRVGPKSRDRKPFSLTGEPTVYNGNKISRKGNRDRA